MTPDRNDLAFLDAAKLAVLVRERQVSPVELVQLYLERIERFDARLRAYITVLPEAALEAARKAEAAVMRGEALGPLHGVPYAVKDQFATAGVRTTVGSRILETHVPTETAAVISRLDEAGGILLGTRSGLPISLQLLGRPFGEATLLRAAHAYEQQTDWSTRRPPL